MSKILSLNLQLCRKILSSAKNDVGMQKMSELEKLSEKERERQIRR